MNKDLRKHELKKAWKEQQCQQLAVSIPMPQQDLRDLFDHLDELCASCDHTLRYTMAFLKQRGLNAECIVTWLRDNGGYCDCEVIANVEDAVANVLDGCQKS